MSSLACVVGISPLNAMSLLSAGSRGAQERILSGQTLGVQIGCFANFKRRCRRNSAGRGGLGADFV